MLQLAYGQYPMEVLSGYFRSAAILVMNAIPVVLLIREAKAMTFEQDYNLFLNQQIILTVICLAFGGVIAALLVRGVMREKNFA